MALFSKLFGSHHSNPAKAAMPYLNQAQSTLEQGYQPYIERGNEAYGGLHPHYQEMLNNPQQFINQLQAGYEPSQGYQYQKDILGKEVGNAAAAGGISGTPEHQREHGELVQKLLSGDMQQWLQNVLGAQQMGEQGEQGFYNQGYESGINRTNDIANLLNSKGTLAYKGQEQKSMNHNANMQLFAQLLGLGGGFAGNHGFGGL